MKFTIIGRKYEVKDEDRNYIEKRLSKLGKFFRDEADARVIIGNIKENDYIEATIYAGGMIYRAEDTDKDLYTAVDRIVDVIERQIRKNKTKLAKKIKKDETLDSKLISGEEYTGGEDTRQFEIVKTKRFQLKPMSAEEAILQMNLLGHSFFIYENPDTNETNVVYKRKDGKYALIESIM